jgi:hypothetical protein
MLQRPLKPEDFFMNFKMLTLGAISLAMMSGAALAGGTNGTSALDDPAKMTPFYTDATMKTMRTDDEFKAAWMAMAQEDRDAITKECGDDVTGKPHDNFCSKTKQLGGAN